MTLKLDTFVKVLGITLGIDMVEDSKLLLIIPAVRFDTLDISGVGGIILKVEIFVIKSLGSGTIWTLPKFCLY